jgi:Micrococcal nuclease (thermonuclease) homologs
MIKMSLLVILLCVIATPCHAWSARVVAVTDGDTITVEPIDGGERIKIRLHGIDAPERKQPSGEAARGLLARVALYQPVVIEEKSRDHYGRSVAVVWLAMGESLQIILLDAGLAWVWPIYCRNCNEWEQVQKVARQSRLGIWSEGTPIPPWEWRRGVRER